MFAIRLTFVFVECTAGCTACTASGRAACSACTASGYYLSAPNCYS